MSFALTKPFKCVNHPCNHVLQSFLNSSLELGLSFITGPEEAKQGKESQDGVKRHLWHILQMSQFSFGRTHHFSRFFPEQHIHMKSHRNIIRKLCDIPLQPKILHKEEIFNKMKDANNQ